MADPASASGAEGEAVDLETRPGDTKFLRFKGIGDGLEQKFDLEEMKKVDWEKRECISVQKTENWNINKCKIWFVEGVSEVKMTKTPDDDPAPASGAETDAIAPPAEPKERIVLDETEAYYFELKIEDCLSGFIPTLAVGFTTCDPQEPGFEMPRRACDLPNSFVIGYQAKCYYNGVKLDTAWNGAAEILPRGYDMVGVKLVVATGELILFLNKCEVVRIAPPEHEALWGKKFEMPTSSMVEVTEEVETEGPPDEEGNPTVTKETVTKTVEKPWNKVYGVVDVFGGPRRVKLYKDMQPPTLADCEEESARRGKATKVKQAVPTSSESEVEKVAEKPAEGEAAAAGEGGEAAPAAEGEAAPAAAEGEAAPAPAEA